MTAQILENGQGCIVSFSLNAAVKFEEIETQPPGYEIEGKINTTSHRNARYRTYAPKNLVTVTDMTTKVKYDPQCISQILAMLGSNQQITHTYPDGSPVVIWGFIESFIPDALKEGVLPEATVKYAASNRNGSRAETGPAISAGTSTTTSTTGT